MPLRITLAAYAESQNGLRDVIRLKESLQAFGGRFGRFPLKVYVPAHLGLQSAEQLKVLASESVEARFAEVPKEAQWYYLSGKVFGAALAETDAAGQSDVIVWLDPDTVFLDEPTHFELNRNIALAYCPVMHNRAGSLFDRPPEKLWSRVYQLLDLTDDLLFPMMTPADQQKIRAYFHVGLLVVRPEAKILRRWPDEFFRLCSDPILRSMCEEDQDKRVFLHQHALTGAILKTIKRKEMTELSGRYNYPIFFEKQYSATRTFDSIAEAITIRCIVSAKHMGPDWDKKLAGPPDKIAWLKERLPQ